MSQKLLSIKDVFLVVSERLFNELGEEEFLITCWQAEHSHFARFNNSKVRQNGNVQDSSISLNLISGKKTVEADLQFCGDVEADYEKCTKILEQLRQEISQVPEDPYVFIPDGSGSSQEYFEGNLLSADTAMDQILSISGDLDMVGIYSSGPICRAVAHSGGAQHSFGTETYTFDLSLCLDHDRMLKCTLAGREWRQKEYKAYMDQARTKLESLKLSSRTIKPGNYRVYLEPHAVSEILEMFSWGGISEAAIRQGESAFCKLRNDKLELSPLFTLEEDFSKGLVPRFNSFGELAPEKLPLFVEGSPFMSTGDLRQEDVLKKLDNGIYISNLHYLNWSDRPAGRITGMTRYACFLVENGGLAGPIKNMRFDDTVYSVFGSALEAVLQDQSYIPDVGSYGSRQVGGVCAPGVLLNSFSFTL